jgi:hypothetical protein
MRRRGGAFEVFPPAAGTRYDLVGDSWHDFLVPVVMVIAIIVVVVAVVFLVMGRGGELSAERGDYAPIDLGPVSATDVALLRPPMGLWGYNMQATDDALDRIAESIKERDVRIVALEQLVTDLGRDHAPMPLLASPYAGARHRRPHDDTADTEAVESPDDTPVDSVDPVDSMDPVPPAMPATEPVRFPFELPRPSGEMSGPPPERSHD